VNSDWVVSSLPFPFYDKKAIRAMDGGLTLTLISYPAFVVRGCRYSFMKD